MFQRILVLSLMMMLFMVTNVRAATNGEVASSAEEICPVREGMELPDLTVFSIEGEPFNINEAVARQPTVLVVYRGGWCPYCSTQLQGLVEVLPELNRQGVQLLAISADRPAKLKESTGELDLKYTLLSDSSMSATKNLGLAFKLNPQMLENYDHYGFDLEEASGMTHHILPVPAVFVVGMDGVIRFSYANSNYKVRLEPAVMLAAVEAMMKDNE